MLQLLVIEESKWENSTQYMLYCAADIQACYSSFLEKGNWRHGSNFQDWECYLVKRLMNDRSIKRINCHFTFSEKALKMCTSNSLWVGPCKAQRQVVTQGFGNLTELSWIVWGALACEETQWFSKCSVRSLSILSAAFSHGCSIFDRQISDKLCNQGLWDA